MSFRAHAEANDTATIPARASADKKRIDKRILVCYKHIILIGFASEAIMGKASFNCMMCCDMRCEMRVRFALPI